MRIAFVEISNFRKLRAVRVELTEQTTLFVGANNSGKTSAMVALRRFLVGRGRHSIHDFTLSHWETMNAIGSRWEAAANTDDATQPTLSEWNDVLPAVDVWLDVPTDELHYVSRLLPTLDWSGGLLGVRLRLEPKDVVELRKDYITAINDVKITRASASHDKPGRNVRLWPQDFLDYLNRRLEAVFTVHGYILDPSKQQPPVDGIARPQSLPANALPIEGDPFEGLMRIDEISAQRGFGDVGSAQDEAAVDPARRAPRREGHKLSEQLRAYYANHLDPFQRPEPSDLAALEAIEAAQEIFDQRLAESFEGALREVQSLGYPGVTDPLLRIATRIRPSDSLNHDAAVRYQVDSVPGKTLAAKLLLPEDYNGLGYQNLISIVFRLMSFRDAWMRVGKASRSSTQSAEREPILPPLHLVLVEEPEAHLHVQVQQVFIRKAFAVLRAHPDLRENKQLVTQLVVSTHSSHVAHETHFSCLRYFRRLPAGMAGDVPVSTVVNLSEVFGTMDDTARFVTRYLRATHCDLFFADAAILIEGPAERILVPSFVRTSYPVLNQRYITWLEIGGSHAHRLAPLLKHLGLLTLIITDLDAANASTKAAEAPARGKGQATRNPTLLSWLPKRDDVDVLLDLPDADKTIEHDRLSRNRVAYQCPVRVRIGGNEGVEALASTFEDALVFENLDLFASLEGSGLIKKFRDAIAANAEPAALGKALFESLKTGDKAEFALNLLELEKADSIAIPTYIKQGLAWLDDQLQKAQTVILEAAVAPVPFAKIELP